ncbi:hypothetical protein HN371_21265 [Candidatus Poribacteria bacterium]|nr:hypothetical protein [Candidatus Poribacteria bacterium]MBT7101341.1 hypothetical protein [Candidatus Poribacteria bacterium]MBT7807790.1 hypothetical protein [Candidatus Poribacteria bacterium]
MVVDDPDVTVLRDLVAHDAWPAGEARSNDGLILRIASDATPHDFIATVRVTADGGGGPWQFDVPFTIEAPDIPFGVVRSWVFDPRPGGNRDSTASPGERVLTRVRVKNEGTDDAFAVSVVLTSDDPDVIVVAGEMTYERWPAGAAENNTGFVVDISGDARPHDARVTVTITTAYGVTSQFSVDIPIAYRAVELLRRSSWVFDPEPGGDRDGQAEAGERVRPRLRLLHVGSEQARNVRIALSTDDADITVAQGDLLYESWEPGVAHTATFVLDVAPDAAVHDVTLRAAIRADNGGPWDMSFTLPIAGPAIAFAVQGLTRVSVNAGGSRAPGIRLRHVGVEPVEDVRITLASTDSDISVGKAQVTHSTWLPGETRDSGDVTVRASADALPRAAPVVVSVTTAQGGLWQFEVAIAIERPTVFRLWGSSISDSSPGGNSDGDANPGETVVPTVRIENHSLEAFDVVATLTTDDPDLTIVDGVDTRATWPGLYRRNRIETLSDFAILIADDAAAHEATVTVTIAASHGDPRQHTISFHIRPSLAKLPAFALRNSWPWDPQPGGNRDGQANPGERVFPRVRIANTGGPATGAVQAVLSIIDDDITVVNGIVTHEAWPAGEARNNNGFVLDISETATPHDVAAVLSVTADDAGPWQFAVTIPIVAQEVVATALLANYPNPFNPETWIPFDLSEAAEVTVHVYDARGVVVRRLDLGRLPPGAYRRRGAAAYWDGRNDFGESVSSGMYMYELRAGASRQMRRMVVRK